MAKGKKRAPDFFLVAVTGALMMFGIIVLASASTPISESKYGDPYYLLKHQLALALLPGIILGFLAFKAKLQIIKKLAPFFLLFCLLLMVLVFFLPVNTESQGSRRWISLGPLSFQPSEPLKLGFILYLASWLESKAQKNNLKQPRNWKNNLIAFLGIIALITVLLFFQPDISTLGVIVATGGLMYFFAQSPFVHTILMLGLGILAVFFLIKSAPYRIERISVFLNPEADPLGLSYQINQALIAVGSGKIFGLGLGMSQQKYSSLPHVISDSIFAVLAEETGFIGSSVLIILFLIFLWRGYRIGKESSDMFSRLSALGITSWIVIQALVNIGSMTKLFPLTGIPLPFISHGGSALITELTAIGLLLNISKTV